MSTTLNKGYGSVNYDNLVIRAGEVGSIQLAAGQGTLSRGSVIDAEGKLLAGAASEDAEAPVAKYILCDDTETDDDDTVTGIIYKTGVFIRNSLIVAQGYELSDVNAEQLRDVGIIVEDAK